MLIVFIFLSLFAKQCSAKCSPAISGGGSSLLELSNDLLDVEQAESHCSLLGGHLVINTDKEVNKVLTEMIMESSPIDLTTEVGRVWAFYRRDPTDGLLFKYARSPNLTEDWQSTSQLGHLGHIDLYTKTSPSMVQVSFCNLDRKKWKVSALLLCGGYNEWFVEFAFYGPGSKIAGHKKVYIMESNNQCTSLRYVSEKFENYVTSAGSFYELDMTIEVFIGAKWSSNEWLWTDGKPADFFPLNSENCAQKVLEYSPYGMEIKQIYCNKTALYACQVEFTASVSAEPCNATYALVSWEVDQFKKFLTNTAHNISVQHIEVESKVENQIGIKKFPFSDGQGVINELRPQTTYKIKVVAKFTGCDDFLVAISLNLTTGVGVPEDPSDAIVSVSSPCTLQLASKQVQGFSYKTVATSDSATTSGTHEGTGTSSTIIIDTSAHEKGSDINITLQVFSCEGESTPVKVKGQCKQSVDAATTTKNNTATTTVAATTVNGTGDANLTDIHVQSGGEESDVIHIPDDSNNEKYILFGIIGGAVGVVLLLAGVAALLCCRNKNSNNATKTSRGKQLTGIHGLESAEERIQPDTPKAKEKGSRKVDKQSKNPDKKSKNPDKRKTDKKPQSHSKDSRKPDEKSRGKDKQSRNPKPNKET